MTKPKVKKVSGLATKQTLAARVPQPAWEMDSYGHFFAQKFGFESATGKEIGAAMLEYQERCAMAKLDMYARIQEVIKEANKKH